MISTNIHSAREGQVQDCYLEAITMGKWSPTGFLFLFSSTFGPVAGQELLNKEKYYKMHNKI